MDTQKTTYLQLIEIHKNKGLSSAKFSHHQHADDIIFTNDGRYIFLFIIHGQISINNKRGVEVIKQGSLAIIDKDQCTACKCTDKTTILEFRPPSRIDRFCNSASTIFSMPCSEQLKFNEQIDIWIESLWNEINQGAKINQQYYCSKLCNILRTYPDNVLGTLYIPLNACSRKCDTCQSTSDEQQDL